MQPPLLLPAIIRAGILLLARKTGNEPSDQAGSTLYTDDHTGYHGMDQHAYDHKRVNHSAKEYVNGMAHTNGTASVWPVTKRGYHGMYRNWSQKHCRQSVNKFAFRLNGERCEQDTKTGWISCSRPCPATSLPTRA